LLVAKGFTVTGPFLSVQDMTFPEKKGADFVFYPEIDVNAAVKIENIGADTRFGILGSTVVSTCDLVLSGSGNIGVLVVEPLSGEKMWIKRIDVTVPKKAMKAEGDACTGGKPPQALENEWAMLHEQMYNTVMKAVDRYVNGEEFQTLKRQSLELRAKKAY